MAGKKTPPGLGSRSGEIGLRAATAIVLAPAVLLAVYLGGLFFLALVLAIGAAVSIEWGALIFKGGSARTAPVLAGVFALGIPVYAGWYLWAAVAGGSALVLALAMAGRGNRIWSGMGVMYAAVPGAALLVLRADTSLGLAGVLYLLLVVWACDSGAFIVGRLFGIRKLAPTISPGKTWAGLWGGVCASAGVGIVFGLIIVDASPVALGVGGACLGVISQVGDLAESGIKRFFGVKDSGKLLPGHGGVMDRVDGLYAAALAGCLIGVIHGGVGSAAGGMLIW